MVPMVRSLRVSALVLLCLALPLATGLGPGPALATGSCANFQNGTLLVPTGTQEAPWPLTNVQNHIGNIHFVVARISPVGQGETFYLWPTSSSNPPGLTMPDFNIQFYRNIGGGIEQPTGSAFNNVGPDTGTVPTDADFGLVWMRTGPDVPFDGNPFGAEFRYRDGCVKVPSGFP